MKWKAYLDVDGVILTRDKKLPDGAPEFISYLLENFDCFWLTTHCRHGENKVIPYLAPFYPKHLLSAIQGIQPNDWDTLKTEGIDLQSNFIWLEDAPFSAEKAVLEQNEKVQNLILIELNQSEALRNAISKIEKLISEPSNG